jgi:hypothetical protein
VAASLNGNVVIGSYSSLAGIEHKTWSLKRPRRRSDDLHGAACAALSVDHLAALFGFHSGAESDGAGAFHFADLVGVMHG